MKKRSGFTLIELMVTIAVIGIIASMAAPSFAGLIKKQDLNKSTRDLISLLNEGRSKAVLERRDITVSLYNSTDTIPASTESQLNWRPFGKTSLRTSSAKTITFTLTGAVKNAVGNTVFNLCIAPSENIGKSFTISKMGTLQQVIDGDCS